MAQTFSMEKLIAIAAGAVLVLGGVGAVWFVAANRAPSVGSYAVRRGTIEEAVDIPGAISSDKSADLSFQQTGQIAHVYVKEGQNVAAGTVLADLDQASLRAGLDQANAAVAAAKAKLDALQSGTRPEQIAIDQNAVSSAEASLGAAIQAAYASADDAVHNQTDNLFSNPESGNPTLVFSISDSQMQINIQASRPAVKGTLADWYKALQSSSSPPEALAPIADGALKQIKSYLDALALAVNNASANSGISASALAGYKTNVVAARTEVVAAVNSLTSAESALASAKGALTLAQSGATPQDIEAENAAVLGAEAAAANAEAALAHAFLKAPFPGVVNNLAAKVGQLASPGAPALSLVNSSGLKIEAYLSEADVAKVKEDDAANATLDAYGTGTVFPAAVTAVNTAQTKANGYSAYKATLHFTNPDSRIKEGMTANVHIVTAKRENVLEVPDRLIIRQGSNAFVFLKQGNAPVRQKVSTGISGGGMVEVASGLNEGDVINNF